MRSQEFLDYYNIPSPSRVTLSSQLLITDNIFSNITGVESFSENITTTSSDH